ncbi:Phosphotransferase enzyme family protein [Roseovarius albus]|uniref:Phosphotransferase enzyme family protein n=1 Tax=Roseovarius albus TaxID=1247867 RepID=A0A1X6Z461_9RHOB|nr:phosphotransferase [Roseovarius albus]SLN40397.1 Phosphotransferase enzyme family protein [Roseovarius albus]
MVARSELMNAFIARSGWDGANSTIVAGDASNRKYFRLTKSASGESAIVMDAPPEKGEDTRPFIKISSHLTNLGFSAPRILGQDESNGFLLLEDLGDDLFARVLELDISLENRLYSCATELLTRLHTYCAPADLGTYNPALMAELATLAFDWYLTNADQKNETAAKLFRQEMQRVLEATAAGSDVLIQRDYHAENLLWLPDRSGTARVGLLDYQDALKGHRAYDLVSLLQDARRDVSPQVEQNMLKQYIALAEMDKDEFLRAYYCLGAQRNLRIVGVFARLCVRDGKAHYVDLIPRVWGYLMHDLDHPALATISALVHEHLPAPSPAILQRLKDKCAMLQTP